jgi:hypothetical protein
MNRPLNDPTTEAGRRIIVAVNERIRQELANDIDDTFDPNAPWQLEMVEGSWLNVWFSDRALGQRSEA